MRRIEHWIGGKPVGGRPLGTVAAWDPATGARQAEVTLGSAADVDEAVRVAAVASEERRPEPSGRSAVSYHSPTSN